MDIMDNTNDIRYLADGITVSNDTRKTGLNNNDLIIGTSGSGKTGGYVVPNIQNISGSMVISDTKGQLCKLFKSELEAKGYDVFTIDFVNPMNSCGYNPLDGIRRYDDGSYCEQDVLTVAHTIMPMLDWHEPFWEKSAASYIVFLIAYCLEMLPTEEQNMISVCKLNQTFFKPNGELFFLEWAESNPDSFAVRKFNHIRSLSKADKTWNCVLEFANRALEPFEFKEAAYIFDRKEYFDICSLGKKKTVLFLNTSDTDRAFDRIVNVFHTQALHLLCTLADSNEDGKLEVPVRLILDDFASGTRIPDFDKLISVIRSRDISVSVILQSLTQLETMYVSAAATTIINNCDHLLYLGSQDISTASYVGYRLGKLPETVLALPRDKAVLITGGEKAKVVKKITPYSTILG